MRTRDTIGPKPLQTIAAYLRVYLGILAKMYLGCSDISATSDKIEPQIMKMALRKILISSKVMP